MWPVCIAMEIPSRKQLGCSYAFDMVNIFTSTDGVILIPFWLNLGFVAERKERSGHRATRGVL
jgi:hypothetical protein